MIAGNQTPCVGIPPISKPCPLISPRRRQNARFIANQLTTVRTIDFRAADAAMRPRRQSTAGETKASYRGTAVDTDLKRLMASDPVLFGDGLRLIHAETMLGQISLPVNDYDTQYGIKSLPARHPPRRMSRRARSRSCLLGAFAPRFNRNAHPCSIGIHESASTQSRNRRLGSLDDNRGRADTRVHPDGDTATIVTVPWGRSRLVRTGSLRYARHALGSKQHIRE